MEKEKKTPFLRFKGFQGEWEEKRLGECGDIYDNLRIPVAENLRTNGSTPYYGANGLQDYINGYTHDGEFVLIAEDGANSLNDYPVNFVNGKIWVNNHAHVIKGKNKILVDRFLSYTLKRVKYEYYITGTSRFKLTASALKDILILFPTLSE